MLLHPKGSPTVSCITYVLSTVFEVFVMVSIGVDTPAVVGIAISTVPSARFHTVQVYDPIVLFPVVSVATTIGLHAESLSSVNSATGSSMVYIMMVSLSGLHPVPP